MLEGAGFDRQLLGTKIWKGRSRIVLRQDPSGGLHINVGALHGMNAGSVLAVYPPAGDKKADKPAGYVRVDDAGALDSAVSAVAFAGKPAAESLPAGGRCELVYYDYGDLRLRVAVVAAGPADGAALTEARRKMIARLHEPDQREGSLIRIEDDRARADWVVRLEKDSAYLVPSGGVPASRHQGRRGKQSPWFGPAPIDDKLAVWLKTRLARIARARNLLTLASSEGGSVLSSGEGVDVQLELVRYVDQKQGGGRQSEVVPWNNGRILREGELVGFRVKNRGTEPVDVTLLFVDSQFGITAFFPRSGLGGGNRLGPGQPISTRKARVTEASGEEHMVLIAVRADTDRPPTDFSCLCQPSLARARGAGDRGVGLDSPLGRLFQNAVFARGKTRGLDSTGIDDHAVRRCTWRVVGDR